MATKKKTTEAVTEPEVKEEVKEEVSLETEEKLLADELERMRRERDELLRQNEALKSETEELKADNVDLEGEHDAAYWEEKINYFVKFYGEEEDVSVKVNGERIIVKRGEWVKIKRKFAAVLEHQDEQRRFSSKYNQKLADDFERQSKSLGLN